MISKTTFILIGILYYILTVLIIVLVLNWLNKREKKKYKDEINTLERDKNLIVGASILSELNKVSALINNEELQKKYDNWVLRLKDIKEVEIPKITDALIEIEDIFEEKDYKTLKKKIVDLELDIAYVKTKSNFLLDEVREITLSEEKNRETITKLKSDYRNILNKYHNNKDEYNMKSIKFEKRITDFALSSSLDVELSLFARFNLWLENIIKGLSKFLKKHNLFINFSSKYEKYLPYKSKYNQMDCISIKILTAIFLTIINILTSLKKLTILRFISMIITFMIGFYIVDIIFLFQFRKKKKQVQNELASVIIYGNSALASGFTIYQSFDLINKEFNGPIAIEFGKISQDLAYGLSLEVAFKRFYERVPLSQIKYIWTTLTVLNREGGEEAKIFSIIEKEFLEAEEIKKEKNIYLSSLNLIYRICLVIPIIVLIVMLFVKKEYLKIYYFTPIGLITFITKALLYILYILIIKKLIGGINK